MTVMFSFKKIRSVRSTQDFLLLVEFEGGGKKEYDLRQLAGRSEFALLFRHPGFIKSVKVDPGGYGISWNDQIDLSGEEVWANGDLVGG